MQSVLWSERNAITEVQNEIYFYYFKFQLSYNWGRGVAVLFPVW